MRALLTEHCIVLGAFRADQRKLLNRVLVIIQPLEDTLVRQSYLLIVNTSELTSPSIPWTTARYLIDKHAYGSQIITPYLPLF